MRNPQFSAGHLGKLLTRRDFALNPTLHSTDQRHELLSRVETRLLDLIDAPLRVLSSEGEKPFFYLPDIEDNLAARACAKSLNRSLKITYPSRNKCVSELKSFVMEQGPFTILKIDLKSFFETIDIENAMATIEPHLDIQTTRSCMAILNSHRNNGGIGLPRGIPISNPISEKYMNDFDRIISSERGILFYCRYVDDIIILDGEMRDKNDLVNIIRSSLPKGLSINHRKIEHKKSSPDTEGKFSIDYLGYNFEVSSTKEGKKSIKDLIVKMSDKKVKRFMDKIVRSSIRYRKDGDFDLFLDRILFLSSNRKIKSSSRDSSSLSGIYYDNSQITSIDDLEKLDKFLIGTVVNQYKKPISIKSILSKTQRNLLLSCSFKNGFEKRKFKEFSHRRLGMIAKAWK